MGITTDVFFYDVYKPSDSGELEFHSPVIGTSWQRLLGGSAFEIIDEVALVVSGFGSATHRGHHAGADNDAYTERIIRFRNTSDTASISFGNLTDTGTTKRLKAVWTFNADILDRIRVDGRAGSSILDTAFSDSEFSQGIHEIRLVGEGETFTAYFDGRGIRIIDVPTAIQDYQDIEIGIGSNNNIEIISIVGRNGKEADFALFFDTDFGPVGGSSGGGGGGGGSGGTPGTGAGNPGNFPCTLDDTVVIVNGEARAIDIADPCMWTGLLWWKLVCEETLTVADYAVEVEVFFNTLSDPYMSIGPIVRLNESTGGHYWATIWNDALVVGKRPSAGVDDVVLGLYLFTPIPGRWYKVRLEVEGNKLRAYLDGTLRVETEDIENSFTEAGCAGVRLSRGNPATDLRFDNFRVWLSVIRPSFNEHPVFADSMSILKDDGITSDFNIELVDVLSGGEVLSISAPKTIHINEGMILSDLASQVKPISEQWQGGDSVAFLGVSINFEELLRTGESMGFRMNVPVSEVFTLTDEERTIHGITDTMTLSEAITQMLTTQIPQPARLTDSVLITRTETGLVGAGGDPDEIFRIRRNIVVVL